MKLIYFYIRGPVLGELPSLLLTTLHDWDAEPIQLAFE